MKLSGKSDRVNPRALQLLRQRLQLAARIAQWFFSVLGHNDLPATDSNLESLQSRRNAPNRFVGIIQTAQSVRMVPFVKPRCVEQYLESPQGALSVVGSQRRQFQCAARGGSASPRRALALGDSRHDGDRILIPALRPDLWNAIGQFALSE